MDRAIPSVNRILEHKWKEKDMKIHQEKLKKAEPTITRMSSIKKSHVRSNKSFASGLKLLEIERENQILLNKMTEIMSGKLNQTLPQITCVKSLNHVARKQKLIKITMENMEMIKRIKQQKSSYNVKKWENERKKEMNYLQNICEYPYKFKDLKNPNKNPLNHNTRLSFTLPYLRKSLSEQHVVFKNVFTFDDHKYLVDIHSTEKKYTLKFKHVNGENNFSAMISKKAAIKIMDSNESYNLLIEKAYAEKMLGQTKAG